MVKKLNDFNDLRILFGFAFHGLQKPRLKKGMAEVLIRRLGLRTGSSNRPKLWTRRTTNRARLVLAAARLTNAHGYPACYEHAEGKRMFGDRKLISSECGLCYSPGVCEQAPSRKRVRRLHPC
jgi:hypothetical protein